MLKKITFITGNAGKAEQLERYLDFPVIHKNIDLLEIQSLDLKEIVTHKAKEAYKLLKTPVLVEDTSLVFNAFKKLPGPFIKWFLEELGNDGLCHLLDGYKEKTALAEVNFGLCTGKDVLIFEGTMKGYIVKEPRGEKGFGWDPIFVPKGYTKTLAEMDKDELKEVSMRRIALRKLETYLKK